MGKRAHNPPPSNTAFGRFLTMLILSFDDSSQEYVNLVTIDETHPTLQRVVHPPRKQGHVG